MEDPGAMLVDCVFDDELLGKVAFVEHIGYPIQVCQGPRYGMPCPILRGESCEKVCSAAGVILTVDLDRARHRAIVATCRDTVGQGTPVRVLVEPGQDRRYRALLSGLQVWTHQPTAHEVDLFRAEISSGPASPPGRFVRDLFRKLSWRRGPGWRP